MAVSFKGGLSLKSRRDRTYLCESKPVASFQRHIYPLKGDTGIDYVPAVSAGDRVKAGQKIARSGDSWELPLHSSVSGKVEAIRGEETEAGNGKAIVIINDELYEAVETSPVTDDYRTEDKNKLIAALQDSGIADMHGGEFICGETLLETPPKYLIINAMQSQTYASALSRRAAENPEEVVEGIRIVQHILKAKEVHICIDSRSTEALDAVKGCIRYDESINILCAKPKYPQAEDSILIKTVTGKSLDRVNAPDLGCVITNSEVMYWVSHTLRTGMPVTERIVTVGGDGILEPDNFRVPFGISIAFLASQAKGFIDTPDRIIVNGAMSGALRQSMDEPTTKNISSVQIMLAPKKEKRKTACIRCGRCARHCPAGLMPNKLNDASIDFKVSKAVKYGISDCTGCGICTYVCPAGIPVADNIKEMKGFAAKIRGKEADL